MPPSKAQKNISHVVSRAPPKTPFRPRRHHAAAPPVPWTFPDIDYARFTQLPTPVKIRRWAKRSNADSNTVMVPELR
ncbi:hypothetical protein PMIN01_06216 [Paraphaeosphaeria minitans]|uniref:Uncharacterized protein n=1 Tax=Paraphaeosphaeria minitans TaxID=565426 RepID=A0A9P6KRX7_9PLEO|nr:hypothetical protein PMIN01_06216 [Paraphaeosphaeria minitans]